MLALGKETLNGHLKKEVIILIMYSGSEATVEIIIRSANFLNILRRQEVTTFLKDWTTVREEGGHLDSMSLEDTLTHMSLEDKQI